MPLTLAQAIEKRDKWQDALDRIADEGQENELSKSKQVNARIDECQRMIAYYDSMIIRLSTGRRPGAQIRRIVPLDN